MGFVSCSFANVFLSDKIILYAIYSASNILTTEYDSSLYSKSCSQMLMILVTLNLFVDLVNDYTKLEVFILQQKDINPYRKKEADNSPSKNKIPAGIFFSFF